eukprot:scaffold5499_cov137-Skeletonema_dohrnii-CCMP3373.AAC.8
MYAFTGGDNLCFVIGHCKIDGGTGFVEAKQVFTTTAMISTKAKKLSLLMLMTVLELKIRSGMRLRRRALYRRYIFVIVAMGARAKKLSGKLGVDVPFYNNDVEIIIQLSCQLRLNNTRKSHIIRSIDDASVGTQDSVLLKRTKRIVMKMMMLLLHDD